MNNKILIVDDEPSNVRVLGRELTDRGYIIESAKDGWSGLKTVSTSRPDLILLDYMMPGMGGIDVLKELRKRGHDIPVIIITAYGTIDRAVEAIKEGAHDFITRPFEPDHVVFVVQKALEQERLRRGVETVFRPLQPI